MDGDRDALPEVLLRHCVAFVLIGGAAIQSHGRIYDTLDIDVIPDAEEDNLARLAAALNEIGCRLVTRSGRLRKLGRATGRVLHAPQPARRDGVDLATRHGQLDVTFAPTGFPGGYNDLAPQAQLQPVAGTDTSVLIAALDDIHESKRQANRPKDRAYLRSYELEGD